jgi:membrane-bound lytic murein transglycosylase MltF
LAALGYQESHLNQNQRSKRGAVGVMQILPSTAANPPISVRNVRISADANIMAGTKYLRMVADEYLDDPKINDQNRMLMAFAAYNAGPGNLRKFRRVARDSGLNQNVWFDNVEIAAARTIGDETVDYVRNIYKYYVAYKLLTEREQERKEARQAHQLSH